MVLGLGSSQGSDGLRRAIAALYGDANVLPEHIMTAMGTTGANMTVLQSLLHPGDHVICSYPTYGQLSGGPQGIPCEVSPWRLDPNNQWKLDLEELRTLIRPSTKMLILNNPSNPTGSHLDANMQSQILDIARDKGLIVFVDEIFRPLFHQTQSKIPPSFVQHNYDKVVVTGSMSKAWGLSGVRVGWIACRHSSLLDAFLNARQYNIQATSSIDEVIATEALSDRCRPAILERHLGYARQGLDMLTVFVERNRDMCSWTKPTAGAIAFIKISSNGKPVDDVEFCRALLKEQGVLLSPGSLCFGEAQKGDFQGFVRVHFTALPGRVQKALELMDQALEKRRNPSSEAILSHEGDKTRHI